jgi:hypothetical protein
MAVGKIIVDSLPLLGFNSHMPSSSRSVLTVVPAWLIGSVGPGAGAYFPDTYMDLLPSRCTYCEFLVIGLIIRRTRGVRAPEWVTLSMAEMAATFNVTIQNIYDCVANLLKLTLIERRGRGSRREYRVIDENFAKAPIRDKRRINPKSRVIVNRLGRPPKPKDSSFTPPVEPKGVSLMKAPVPEIRPSERDANPPNEVRA